MNKGFADLCLTTWLRRRTESINNKSGEMKQHVLHPPAFIDLLERETRFELATLALARRCSTTELLPLSMKTVVFKVVERNLPLFVPLSQTRVKIKNVLINGGAGELRQRAFAGSWPGCGAALHHSSTNA